jgi:uncharacterized protein (UPF0333 family)
MANPFNITAATNTIHLDAKLQAQTAFTVNNNSGRAMRGRARIVAQNPASEPWITLPKEVERDFPIAGTHQYDVQIAVPTGSPAGSYPFRLDMVGTENPDEEFSQGPSVTFEVPAPAPVKKPFPIWIPIVAVVALLVVGGVIAFLVIGGNNREAEARAASQTATVVAQVAADQTATTVALGLQSADQTSTALAIQESANATQTAEAINAAFTYDFVSRADSVTWRAGSPPVTLPFNGNDGDERGFVVWRDSRYALNDGSIAPLFLEMHPNWVPNGTIYGCYTDVYTGGAMVQSTDHISGKVGFVSGGGAGDATFRISLLAQGVVEQDIVNIPLAYAAGTRTFDVPFGSPPYVGRPVDVCLRVDAGPTAAQDWASWVDVKITR